MNIKSRLQKLEAKHGKPLNVVIKYADQTSPEELKALDEDPDTLLIVVQYASEVIANQPSDNPTP